MTRCCCATAVLLELCTAFTELCLAATQLCQFLLSLAVTLNGGVIR
eukprot:COSAG01_NODE_12019_length_1815_cov_32.250000_2_plen_46_part_00